ELLHAGVRDDGVRDPGVGLAVMLRYEAGALEALEQAGDAGRTEDDRPGQVDSSQAPVGSLVQLDEHVEVAQREAVRGLEEGREHRREGRAAERPPADTRLLRRRAVPGDHLPRD